MPDRRSRLLARFHDLHPTRAAKFKALQIPPDDLDAIEAALDELTKPRRVDDKRLADPVVADLSARAMALAPVEHAMLDALTRAAFDGPGPISYKLEPFERNLAVCRALVAMCEHGWDEAAFRVCCAVVTDDPAAEQPGVALAEVLAQMSTDEAAGLLAMVTSIGAP